jgi:hypothetical protein
VEKKISWRGMRKSAEESFTKGSVKQFHEKQTTEAVHLTSEWLAKSAQWNQHLRRSAASTMLSIVYDHPTITSEQDHHTVDLINDFADRLTSAAYPGAHLAEFFHWMRYIPSR